VQVNPICLSAQQAADSKIAKYSAEYEMPVKKEASSSPIVFMGLNDRLEYLYLSSKSIGEEKEALAQEMEEKFEEVSKVANEAAEELERASREAERFFEAKQYEVESYTKNILSNYQYSGSNMSDKEIKRMLMSALYNVNVSLPSSLRHKMSEAASKLGSLNSKTMELSRLASMDDSLSSRLTSNSYDIARIGMLTGNSVEFVTPQIGSAGRFYSNSANSINSNISSMYSNIDFNNDFQGRKISRLKDKQFENVKPQEEAV